MEGMAKNEAEDLIISSSSTEHLVGVLSVLQ